MDECRQADPDFAEDLKSSSLLDDLHRKSRTKHESACGATFRKKGLSCPVPIQRVDVGRDTMHPVLRVTDFLKALAECGKLPLLWGSKEASSSPTDVLARFWRRWRSHDDQHEVFQYHKGRLHEVLPLQLHADEGQYLKKSGIMIVNWQSPLGFGIATSHDDDNAMHLNYIGHSCSTRFLFTTCTKRSYGKGKGYVLTGIVDALARELRSLFYDGVELKLPGGNRVTMYVALLGLKGDWPIQARIGNLTRHFARKGVYKVTEKSGFCHLCRAGETNYDANDYSSEAAWRATVLKYPPWDSEGPLCKVPQSPAQRSSCTSLTCFIAFTKDALPS